MYCYNRFKEDFVFSSTHSLMEIVILNKIMACLEKQSFSKIYLVNFTLTATRAIYSLVYSVTKHKYLLNFAHYSGIINVLLNCVNVFIWDADRVSKSECGFMYSIWKKTWMFLYTKDIKYHKQRQNHSFWKVSRLIFMWMPVINIIINYLVIEVEFKDNVAFD